MAQITDSELRTIITDPNGASTLVRKADELGKALKEMGLATSQIRALFGEVRQIEAQWDIQGADRQKLVRRLILLKPKMAYRARRERGRAVQELVSVLDPAVDLVIRETDSGKQNECFHHFVEFFEAILAYHKAYGGN